MAGRTVCKIMDNSALCRCWTSRVLYTWNLCMCCSSAFGSTVRYCRSTRLRALDRLRETGKHLTAIYTSTYCAKHSLCSNIHTI